MKLIIYLVSLFASSIASAQVATDAAKPEIVFDGEFNLAMEVRAESCKPVINLHWKPYNPIFKLGMTDSYRVSVDVLKKGEIRLGQWYEKFSYESTRPCGKNKCVDTNYKPIFTGIKVKYGENVQAFLNENSKKTRLDDGKVLESFLMVTTSLGTSLTRPVVSEPNTQFSGRNARRVEGPCAQISPSTINIANVKIFIMRRHP